MPSILETILLANPISIIGEPAGPRVGDVPQQLEFISMNSVVGDK